LRGASLAVFREKGESQIRKYNKALYEKTNSDTLFSVAAKKDKEIIIKKKK
jgi:hypothetical protein